MKAATKALREAFEADRVRQMWELYDAIWRTYGVSAGESFKAFLWWGWDYRITRPREVHIDRASSDPCERPGQCDCL